MFGFSNVFRPPVDKPKSSFDGLTEEELETHLSIRRYGDFELTDAVAPSYDLRVIPREGYRHDIYADDETETRVPILMAAATRKKLWDLFDDLLKPLGECVDVILETSHGYRVRHNEGHEDLCREQIDLPVLRSVIQDYRDLLLNDGCAGIAVLNPHIPLEVQFNEHKLIIVYGERLNAFEDILHDHGVLADESIKFITEAEHVHSSSPAYGKQFDELKLRLGMDGDWNDSDCAEQEC